MDKNLFIEMLIKKAREISINIDESEANNFFEYMEELIRWNEKVNLTAITKPEEIITKHFIDSLTIEKYIPKNASIIDVGTGAGFPGIPIKILKPETKITLLDSLNKRIIFLEKIIAKLRLTNIFAVHGRAEELGREEEHRETFDIATSRAVAGLNGLLEYMAPFVKVNGKIICMKGPKIEEELKESKKAIQELGLEIEKIEKISFLNEEMERNILILNKKNETPQKYPRRGVNIRKSPL